MNYKCPSRRRRQIFDETGSCDLFVKSTCDSFNEQINLCIPNSSSLKRMFHMFLRTSNRESARASSIAL